MKKSKNADIKYQKMLQDAAESIIDGTFNIKEYYGLTDGGLEAIYSIGLEMYKHKQYEKARSVFAILSMLEPTSTKYLYASGLANFMAEDFVPAMQFFRLALLNGDYSPKSLLRMAECSIKLEDLNLAKQYLTEAIRISQEEQFKNDKETFQCIYRAKMILSGINNEIAQQAQGTTHKHND